MNLLPHYITSLLLTSIIFFSMGTFVLWKNTKRLVNITFFLHFISVAIWSFFEALSIYVPDHNTALLLWRINHVGVIFIPIFFLHFVFSLLNIKETKRKVLFIAYILGFIFLILDATNLLIADAVPKFSFRHFQEPGIIYPIFFFLWIVAVVYGHYELFKAYSNSTGARRNELKYHFWGVLLGYVGGAPNFLPSFHIEIYPINPFGTYGIILYATILTYAIAKYRLMDINIAIRNFLSYGMEVVVLSIFLFLLLGAFGFKEILPAILSSTGIAIGLIPLRTGIRRLINKVIFRGKYDYQAKLGEITSVVPTIIDQDKLIKYIVDSITRSMHIDKGVLFLKDERKDMFLIQYYAGLNGEISVKTIDGNCRLIKWLKEHRDVILKYELYHLLPSDEVEGLWNEIKPFDSELVIPIHKGENLIGILCLSHKGGGDVFNQDDFRIFHTIANQVAVVIENIRLFNKLIHTDRQTFLETLASGVSHEMRNRLVAVRTFIDLFPERVDLNHVEKDYIEFRGLAAREMERLTKIIDGLLSYSRAITIGGEALNVNDLLEEAQLIIQPKLKEKEISIVADLDKNISSLNGDKGRLLQIFINIMQNGIEAMQRGGQLEIKSLDKGEDIELSISDNGKGIPQEHLDAIFEPFFTTKHSGTGLGLSIVQRIVRDHNGTIGVTSEVGKGTTFTITLPKKGKYKPGDITPKEGLGYWDVKKEHDPDKTG